MWPNPQFPADIVIFTEEILNEKFHFLCSGGKRHYLFYIKFSLFVVVVTTLQIFKKSIT